MNQLFLISNKVDWHKTLSCQLGLKIISKYLLNGYYTNVFTKSNKWSPEKWTKVMKVPYDNIKIYIGLKLKYVFSDVFNQYLPSMPLPSLVMLIFCRIVRYNKKLHVSWRNI